MSMKEHRVSRKKTGILIFCITMVLLLAALILCAVPATYNYRMQQFLSRTGNLRNADISADAQADYLERIQLASEGKTDFVASWAVTGALAEVPNTMTLPFDLAYYAEPVAGKSACVIPRGTTVYLTVPEDYAVNGKLPDEASLSGGLWGYGFLSWPTEQRGWRLVRPFVTEEDRTLQKFYYVKLEDLSRLQQARYDSLKMTLEEALAQGSGLPYSTLTDEIAKQQGLTPSLRRDVELRTLDVGLLSNGIFRSPDLLKPAPPLWLVIALAAVWVLANVGLMILFIRKKTHQ